MLNKKITKIAAIAASIILLQIALPVEAAVPAPDNENIKINPASTILTNCETKVQKISNESISEEDSEPKETVIADFNRDILIHGNIRLKLTQANSYDCIFFHINEPKTILFDLISSNSDYRATLCTSTIDKVLTRTNIQIEPGNAEFIYSLQPGDYAIYINSLGKLGDDYLLGLNDTNPACSSHDTVNLGSSSLETVTVTYSNGTVFENGIRKR